VSSESGVFHHLPCFTPTILARSRRRKACLASEFPPSSLQYPVARALPAPQRLVCHTLPPFCPHFAHMPVLSSPKSYRLSHLLAPLKGTGQPSRLRLAAKHDATIPNHRRSVETSTETSPNTGLVHPSCCACRSAESPSPALCTFVALGCSNLSLSSSNCALSHDRRDTSSHRLGF
jgi:hypothetical protein